ncbi:MAG TPA: LytTR family DNA-binding domain-containing protein, partial [Ignavibacteriaceae bacterium]|nr:LytTR family DNA-binding domain-containing protein [Ignavibacteriaceae bacterium]
KPDSIFLDVKLGTGSGFDLMNKISAESTVIFISASEDYALRAFEVNALDYLKKPIDFDRLSITISRLLSKIQDKDLPFDKNNSKDKSAATSSVTEIQRGYNHGKIELSKVLNNHLINEDDDIEDEEDSLELEEGHTNKKALEYDDRLFITVDGISRFVKICTIQCITAEKDYTYLYLEGLKKVLVLKPMVEWEERLPSKYFVRIHRSTIVNLEYVNKVEKWFNSSYHVFVQNISEPFQMSRRYASKLKERFK